MSKLFEPASIRGLQIKNRFVRSATFEGMADHEGRPTARLEKIYLDLAEGGVGLIITCAAFVDRYRDLPEMPEAPYPAAMDEDRYAEDWRPIVQRVHRRGSAIAMQIVHPGRLDVPELRGGPAIAPSAVASSDGKIAPRAMTLGEIEEMVERFAQSCRRVKEAGFDAVQLHGGHGYLISSFISPYLNRRDDAYGGNTENRSRFIVDIVKRARELVGADYPIMIKLNCEDFILGGLEMEEAARVAAIIAGAGVDCIEVTGGIGREGAKSSSVRGINRPEKEAYFKAHAAAVRSAVNIPIMLVGGLRTPSVMQGILEEGVADLLSLCRPFIREPFLLKRWQKGDGAKATCISCGQCSENVFLRPLRCYVEEKLREKRQSKSA